MSLRGIENEPQKKTDWEAYALICLFTQAFLL